MGVKRVLRAWAPLGLTLQPCGAVSLWLVAHGACSQAV